MNQTVFKYVFLFLVLFTVYAWAGNIPSPPPLLEEPVAEQHYLRTIYDNFNKLEVTTTNPDGTRNGKKGDMLLLQNSGTDYLVVNVGTNNTWRSVILQDLP